MQLYITCARRQLRADLWVGRPKTPMLIAASACWNGRTLLTPSWPEQASPRFCDSGGFVFASQNREYPFSIEQYLFWLWRMLPDDAAILDYPCEPEIAGSPEAVRLRQLKTIRNAQALLAARVPWRWVCVLQGHTIAQYEQHARDYRELVFRGQELPTLMGIGSLCHRKSSVEIEGIVEAMAAALPGVQFHLFGVKLGFFQRNRQLHPSIASADTGAWNGRFAHGIDVFNAEMHERGQTQAQTEVSWALPRYEEKVARALQKRKQVQVFASSAGEGSARDLVLMCPCGWQLDESLWDVWDDREHEDVAGLLRRGLCPMCLSPLSDAARHVRQSDSEGSVPVSKEIAA